MSIRELGRKVVPLGLWRAIRRRQIVLEHRRVGRICDALIDKYDQGKLLHFPIKPKRTFATERIIWQYWGQGFDNVPEVVRICLNSVERHKGDYLLVRLTDENLAYYIDFPEGILQKRTMFLKAHFADLLRCVLLATYGGVWIDATLLLTGPLPEKYFTQGFFMFQRDDNEPFKKCWEDNFIHYWGWYKGFKVRVLNSLVYGKRGNETIAVMCDMLYDYWTVNESLPHYFFFQILFNELTAKHPELNCRIVNDCLPHYATQTILDNFMSMTFLDVLKLCNVHKASYKMSDAHISTLKKLLAEAGELPLQI